VAARIQDRYPGHYRLNDTLFPVGSTVETQYIASLLEAGMNIATYILDSWRLEKRSEKGV